jgi:hypothetical protein
MPAMTLTLSNVGNPDFGQDPNRPLPGTSKRLRRVFSLEEASKACRAYIEENELGGGNWTGGKLVGDDGEEVGRVSYNGAVWPPGPSVVGQEPLYVPGGPRPAKVDPLAWEKVILDVPGHGKVSVSGCLRIATLASVPGAFEVGGRRYDFSAYVEFGPDGLKAMPASINMHPDGRLDLDAACPKSVLKALKAVVKDWASEPEGMAVLLSNEVKDLRKTVESDESRVGYAQAELSKREAELEASKNALVEAEEMLESLTSSGPRP